MPGDDLDYKMFAVQFPAFEDTVALYANHATVQFTGNEFVIAFYAVFPPILSGTKEERLQKLESVGAIPAKCVARVVLPKERMPSFMEALQTNAAAVDALDKTKVTIKDDDNAQ
jgi:hypothetical protein